jgi:hypothetical protein
MKKRTSSSLAYGRERRRRLRDFTDPAAWPQSDEQAVEEFNINFFKRLPWRNEIRRALNILRQGNPNLLRQLIDRDGPFVLGDPAVMWALFKLWLIKDTDSPEGVRALETLTSLAKGLFSLRGVRESSLPVDQRAEKRRKQNLTAKQSAKAIKYCDDAFKEFEERTKNITGLLFLTRGQ